MKRREGNMRCSLYNAKMVLKSMGNAMGKTGQFWVANEERREMVKLIAVDGGNVKLMEA